MISSAFRPTFKNFKTTNSPLHWNRDRIRRAFLYRWKRNYMIATRTPKGYAIWITPFLLHKTISFSAFKKYFLFVCELLNDCVFFRPLKSTEIQKSEEQQTFIADLAIHRHLDTQPVMNVHKWIKIRFNFNFKGLQAENIWKIALRDISGEDLIFIQIHKATCCARGGGRLDVFLYRISCRMRRSRFEECVISLPTWHLSSPEYTWPGSWAAA